MIKIDRYLAHFICLVVALSFLAATLVGCGEGVPELPGSIDNVAPAPSTPTTTVPISAAPNTTTTTISPLAPSTPANLTAAGSLQLINLNWGASTGTGPLSYNVFKSSDGVNFIKTADSPVTSTTYSDPIPSPSGDGVTYYYMVSALNGYESAQSSAVKCLHGTRLSSLNPSGFTTTSTDSPYVGEGTILVNGGNLKVAANTKLYLLDNCQIDLEQGNTLEVNGLLRVLASTSSPAVLTAHKTGGTLADNEGLFILFDGADNYDKVTGTGTSLKNTSINNLAKGQSLIIRNCSPYLYNIKVTANSGQGEGLITLGPNTGAGIERCSFERSYLIITADLRLSSLNVRSNLFRNGKYSLALIDLNNSGINFGQVQQNNFDGSKQAYLSNMTGGDNVPIGNNYWSGATGTPPVPDVLSSNGTTINYSFLTALNAPPIDAGPTW